MVIMLALGTSAVIADVVAVVSAKSPIISLSKNQIIDIFLGKTTRFPDGSSAVPIDQTEGSGARDEFYARFARMSAPQLKAFWSKIIFTGRGQPPRAAANGMEAKRLVIANPGAISYIDRDLIDGDLKVVQIQ
jgi:ABC-type phosphate transport system substrate-binding protein